MEHARVEIKGQYLSTMTHSNKCNKIKGKGTIHQNNKPRNSYNKGAVYILPGEGVSQNITIADGVNANLISVPDATCDVSVNFFMWGEFFHIECKRDPCVILCLTSRIVCNFTYSL